LQFHLEQFIQQACRLSQCYSCCFFAIFGVLLGLLNSDDELIDVILKQAILSKCTIKLINLRGMALLLFLLFRKPVLSLYLLCCFLSSQNSSALPNTYDATSRSEPLKLGCGSRRLPFANTLVNPNSFGMIFSSATAALISFSSCDC
jgi:hypothetical protein